MIICFLSFYYYNFPSLEWIEEIPQPNLQFPLTEPVDSPSNLGLRCSIIHLNSCEKWPPYFLCNQLTIQLANSLYGREGGKEEGDRGEAIPSPILRCTPQQVGRSAAPTAQRRGRQPLIGFFTPSPGHSCDSALSFEWLDLTQLKNGVSSHNS